MNKLSHALGVIIVMGALNVFAQEQAQKPTYQEGDFWQFKVNEKGYTTRNTSEALNGIYELIYTEGKVKAFLLDGTKKEEMNLAPDTNAEILLGLLGGTDERSLKFPLSVGQKWTYQYRWRAPGARETETYYGEVNVIGVEQTATSAGTFKTFRLEQSVSRPRGPSRGGRQTFSTTYFFSPDTKSVIKSNHVRDDGGTRDVELIKFGSVPK